MNWSSILNWRLLSGSHKFPGPDGGTCINEAAIVAAGFEYREIQSADDCPACFSRPIAAYAINLNDRMTDDLRQELLSPFVTRLAGTADSRAVETKRAHLIVIRTVREILPIALRAAGLEDQAQKCATIPDDDIAAAAAAAATAAATTTAPAAAAAAKAAYAAKAAADAAYAADAAADAAYAAKAAYAAYAANAAYAAKAAADAAYAADAAADAAYAAKAAYAAAAYASREIWLIAVSILDEAIKLGKQAEPIEIAMVKARMDSVRQVAGAA